MMTNFLAKSDFFELLPTSFLQTCLMVLISTVLAYLVGLPLGILLYVTGKNGLIKNKVINSIAGFIVNILRSIPCLLLIVLLMPLTRLILKYGTGHWYSIIIPLFFASFPFVARLVEQSLQEVDAGVIEASKSLGASNFQIIKNVILVEAKPSLIGGVAVAMVSILGYTAFAYDIAAGGLISYAYSIYTNNTSDPWNIKIWAVILLIIIIVQVIQELGLFISRKLDKRRKIK